MPKAEKKTQPEESRIEEETRRKYSGDFYKPDSIMRERGPEDRDYFARLDIVKRRILLEHCQGKATLDLCCATGLHLLKVAPEIERGIGVDFSKPFLKKAEFDRKNLCMEHLSFSCANARQLPFRDKSFGCVYSFSSLYNIPQQQDVFAEVFRILEPGGYAVLGLGNRHSLNHIVSMAHSETAQPCHIDPGKMKALLRGSGFTIKEHHAFQILPLWGSRPKWMLPFLLPIWKTILQTSLAGHMLDAWICRIPGLRHFAFRHIFVCTRKAE
ncbi:MAG: class I SAM-dependent methyltransferase [Candidatus Sumerlaeia bacterium]